jgi:dimethylamine monooxygenase subunit A
VSETDPRNGVPYVPFDGRPFKQRIGVRPLDLARWIEPDDRFDEEMHLKDSLLTDRHADVFASMPYADEAGAEVQELVEAHMRALFPDLADRRTRLMPADLHPLDAAGRMVQEDLCIMTVHNNELVLGAASLCFPGRWRLREKLGLSMAGIHGPVARYAADIGKPTDDLLGRLTIDKPVWRLNWSVVDDGALFQPTGHGRADGPSIAPTELFFRLERQTLRRLPRTGAILFTIRTYMRPLPAAIVVRQDRERLAAALREMPDDVRAYKSLSAFAEETIAWLEVEAHDP